MPSFLRALPMLAILIAAPTVASVAHASDAPAQPLRIGDAAPAIDIEHWLRPGAFKTSDAADDFSSPQPGSIYVIEFWATWCGPCIVGFPALSELQEEFADQGLTVIAVSDEDPATAKAIFARSAGAGRTHGDNMRFAVAADPDQSTHNAYLHAAGRNSIPTAFLIGPTGRIEWIGHPKLDGLHDAVKAVIAGTWDRDAYAKRLAQSQSTESAFETALQNGDWDAAEAAAGNDVIRLTQIAFAIGMNSTSGDTALLERAERLASRALEASGQKEAFAFHALALVRYRQGRLEDAVSLEKKAVALDDGKGGAFYTAALKKYEEALGKQR